MTPQYRACPHCSLIIEHREACKHMTCKSCTKKFCWVCLGVLNKDKTWSCGAYNEYCGKVAQRQKIGINIWSANNLKNHLPTKSFFNLLIFGVWFWFGRISEHQSNILLFSIFVFHRILKSIELDSFDLAFIFIYPNFPFFLLVNDFFEAVFNLFAKDQFFLSLDLIVDWFRSNGLVQQLNLLLQNLLYLQPVLRWPFFLLVLSLSGL